MLLPNQKPSSSYSLLKFIYVTSQLRHSFVVHPLLRKILDPPRLIGVRGWVWGYNRCRGVGLGCGVWGYNRCEGVGVGCGAFRDNNCKVGDKIETLCLSLGLFQTILRIHQEYASENGKKIVGNVKQECLCAYASGVSIRSI